MKTESKDVTTKVLFDILVDISSDVIALYSITSPSTDNHNFYHYSYDTIFHYFFNVLYTDLSCWCKETVENNEFCRAFSGNLITELLSGFILQLCNTVTGLSKTNYKLNQHFINLKLLSNVGFP